MNEQMNVGALPTSPTTAAITRESILAQAMSLSPADREAVAEQLLLTVDQPEDGAPLSPEWQAEIDRRVAAYERGEADPIDAFEHLRSLREKYAR